MRAKLSKSANSRGITLVELAVAILILTIATIGALRVSDQSQRAISGETPRMLARLAARNHLEQLQLLGPNADLPGQVTLGPYELTVTQQTKITAAGLTEVTVIARSNTGEGAQLVAYLPPFVPKAGGQ